MQNVKIAPYELILDTEKQNIDYMSQLKELYESSLADYRYNKDYVKVVNQLAKLQKSKIKQNLDVDEKTLTNEGKRLLVCNLLDPFYRKRFSQAGLKQLVKIVDNDRKLVSIVNDKAAIREQVEQAIVDYIVENGVVFDPTFVSKLGQFWLLYGQTIQDNQFVTYAGFDEDDLWAVGRPSIKPVKGELPTWIKFISRMNDPQGFAAWIYGIASKKYLGRQVLWLHGENGVDGKTFIQKRFAEALFQNVDAWINNAALAEGAARFLRADFENKIIVFWDDCNNQKALMKEEIKQISAGGEGNKSRIEGKGTMAYFVQLETRMWINSNYPPIVTDDNFVKSRLLYIELDKMNERPDPNLKKQFIDEMPAFLYYARDCYNQRCPDNLEIKQNHQTIETIEQFVDESTQDVESVFTDNFSLEDPTEAKNRISTKDIHKIIKNAGLKSSFEQHAFYNLLETKYDRPKKQTRINGKKVYYIEGLEARHYPTQQIKQQQTEQAPDDIMDIFEEDEQFIF